METNFLTTISNIQNVFKIWRMRNLTLEGKKLVFKILALSKIVHLCLISVVTTQIIEEIENIQKNVLWNRSTPKIKHSSLYNSFASGGVRNVDINTKIASLQCSWIKRLYDDNFQEWKLIPLHLINTTITPAFKFHLSLALSFQLYKFPKFYQNIFQFWSTCFHSASTVPSRILSEFLWFNRNIKVDNRPIFFKYFSEKEVNFVSHMMKENGEIKSWNDLKNELKLEQRLYLAGCNLLTLYQVIGKTILKHSDTYSQNLILLDHHLVKSNSLFNTEKLESRKLYCIINSSRKNKPTSQIYFEKKFDSIELNWRVIYTLPRKVTTNTHLRSFQYKILNNILYLNAKLFVFGLSTTSSCSFCNCFGENITHLFCDCTITVSLEKITVQLKDNITFLPLTPQAAIFGTY